MEMDDADFRDALRRRIATYSEQEVQVAERLDELQQALDDLRKRRRNAEALYRAEYGDEDLTAYSTSEHEGDHQQAAEAPARYVAANLGPLFGESWAGAMTSVLAESTEPLHVAEIWRRMRDGGFTSSARDPLRSIVAVAIRTPGVVRAAPNTYTLAGGDA